MAGAVALPALPMLTEAVPYATNPLTWTQIGNAALQFGKQGVN
jgi:hypothetical protein